MPSLETPLTSLYGVGPAIGQKLTILGLERVEDLLYYYPRRYEDYSRPRQIDQVIPGQRSIIEGRVLSIENDTSPKKRIKLTKVLVADATGQLALTFFNQPFLIRVLKEGTHWLFAGMVESDFRGNLTMASPDIEREPKILPIYGETAGLTSKFLRRLLGELRIVALGFVDWLPQEHRTRLDLIPLGDALWRIHFPESIEQISQAKRRLAFDELFFLLAKVEKAKRELKQYTSPILPLPKIEHEIFLNLLPFSLTDSQTIASKEILQDLNHSRPMNRLLEGDVGSGKTVVGLLAALATIINRHQVVWMAPTEILANQHYATATKFLEIFHYKIVLLTSTNTRSIKDGELSEADFIIGTQAVIQEKVSFPRLGLVIIDEQHRFGVNQRAHLLRRGNPDQDKIPHLLAMTATPIPRTLALTIFGDLDISLLQSVPTGRKPVVSRFVDPAHRAKAYEFIREQVKVGRQVFVVCPIIDGGPEADQEKKSAYAEFIKLSRTVFPDFKVGLLHGRLKPLEKADVMAKFSAGSIDVLVSTAVIEVGIDIPNATVMMIENADRFGLAQLHQFRGRVGRGVEQSYCFVFTENTSPLTLERLKRFTEIQSGFELADLDLQLRGPGQLTGWQQSGLLDLKLANLSDISVIQRVRQTVVELFDNGIEREPMVKRRLDIELAEST